MAILTLTFVMNVNPTVITIKQLLDLLWNSPIIIIINEMKTIETKSSGKYMKIECEQMTIKSMGFPPAIKMKILNC